MGYGLIVVLFIYATCRWLCTWVNAESLVLISELFMRPDPKSCKISKIQELFSAVFDGKIEKFMTIKI